MSGPDFNTEANEHADKVAERFDAKREDICPLCPKVNELADAVAAFDKKHSAHRPLTDEERDRFAAEADEARAEQYDLDHFNAHPEDYR